MNQRTTTLTGWLLAAFTALAAAWPITSSAQAGDVDLDAIALLRRSTDYVAALKQFRLEMDTTIEIVISTGQKLQLDHRVVAAVKRPNELRAERVGEMIGQVFYYDGKSLTMSIPAKGYYATAAAPANLEAMLDFARDKLNVLAPGADFVYKNAFERLTEGLTSAVVVGDAMVHGVRCVHLAFRNAEVDWQVWIEQGDRPLPRKFVVTSKKMPESPQFVVTMTKWDTAPKLNDAMFRFVPPKGSQRIDFLPAPGAAKK
jgi:hypothetical protein